MKSECIRTAEPCRFWRDETGSVFLEFTVTMFVFFLFLFGTVEIGLLFHQWNLATKAVQLGARIAAVSNPVSHDLLAMTGLDPARPGDPMPNFDRTCNGETASCTGGAYDDDAMRTLVYGRGDDACNSTGGNIGMCDIFNKIKPKNVIVRYQYTGLGYAGRPGGPVPTITVSLQNIDFNFVALDGLLGLGPIAIPGLRTTITGEDLRGSGS
jgi:TadE-like protein